MSIINKSFPSEIENKIISFLNPVDQVVISGVNRSAYYRFHNNIYFKDLFAQYSLFGQNAEFLDKELVDKNLEHLCFTHPTNCWKVACCVFQTGKLNFSKSFIDEEVQLHIGELEKEKAEIEVELKKVSLELDQAMLIHKETKFMLAEDSASTIEKLIPERKNEYYALIQDIASRDFSFKEYLEELLAFDQRLSPIVNDEKYTDLQQTKNEISHKLKFVDEQISHYVNLSVTQPLQYRSEVEIELNDYFDELNKFFKNSLEIQLCGIIQKPKKLTGADIHAFLAGFQAYQPLCEIQEIQISPTKHFHNIKASLPRYAIKCSISLLRQSLNKNEIKDQQIISNIDEIFSMIDKELFAEYIEQYAKQPLSSNLILSRNSIANNIHDRLGSISLDFIKEALARTIFNQNKEIFSTTNTENAQIEPTLGEIEQAFGKYVFETMIDSYAEQPIENITIDSYELKANNIHTFFKVIPLKTVKGILADAVYMYHGDEGIKKITILNA